MALFNIDTDALASTAKTTAAARIMREVSQAASPKLLKDVQNVMSAGGAIGRALGISTGIGAVDSLLGLSSRDVATPMLGGLTMRQAQAIYDQVRAVRVARKNLWFIRVTDRNPPVGSYQPRNGGLADSQLGAASSNARIGGGESIASLALSSFDMLAVDCSYSEAIMGDTDQIGMTFIDRPTGSTATELSITTMDDEAGTIKRWFEGKQRQVANPDGTAGLPAEYLLDIEIVHAIPSDQVEGYSLAYKASMALRAHSIQFEMSRRDQALSEVQMIFSEFDPFMSIAR